MRVTSSTAGLETWAKPQVLPTLSKGPRAKPLPQAAQVWSVRISGAVFSEMSLEKTWACTRASKQPHHSSACALSYMNFLKRFAYVSGGCAEVSRAQPAVTTYSALVFAS